MHEGTGGAPINHTNFGPITPENSREAIKILGGGLVRDRCRPLGHVHRTMGVQDPLCDAAATETSGTRDHIPQGVLKVVVSEPVSQELRNKGAIEPAPLTRAFTADCSLFARQQGSGGRS